jgi:hypothetical protein
MRVRVCICIFVPHRFLVRFLARDSMNSMNDAQIEVLQIQCLECGRLVTVEANGVEMRYGLNVFCPGGECEDKYAWKQ